MKKHILASAVLSAAFIVPAITFASSSAATATTKTTANQSVEKVNINTANLTTFETIKGLGEKKSQAIINYRNENGSFKTVNDLTKVQGISDKLLAKIEGQLTIG